MPSSTSTHDLRSNSNDTSGGGGRRETVPRSRLTHFVKHVLTFFVFMVACWVVVIGYFRMDTHKLLRGDAGGVFDNFKNFESSVRTKDQIDTLVIVAGHAVIKIDDLQRADKSDASWYLLTYQRNQGFPGIITSHIKRGIQLAENNPRSLLVFSGGETRKNVGPTSEAASYYYLAATKKWASPSTKSRTYLEEYARDSFENLLFSICRFREVTGYYPSHITVVGFDFKKKRFTDLHRQAIGFPASNFTYEGMAPDPSLFNRERAERGEFYAIQSFERDSYGCNDHTLSDKREQRNPFHRTVPYTLACPEIKALIEWCGADLFVGINSLPWTSIPLVGG